MLNPLLKENVKKKKSVKKADRGSITTFLLGTILLYCWIRGIQFLMIYTCTFCGPCQRVIESVCYFLSSLKRFKKYRDSRVDTAQRPNRLSKKCFVSFAAIIKHLLEGLKVSYRYIWNQNIDFSLLSFHSTYNYSKSLQN